MKIFLVIISVCCLEAAQAQSPILTSVKIEFEQKVNVWATMRGFGDELKNRIPQYSSTLYNYETDGKKSIYQKIPNDDNSRGTFFAFSDDKEKSVFTDFGADEQVALKSIFEKTYLLTDSLKKCDWKITNDFREIAGFNCRRATTVIMDSVFVVAFYTDEIMTSGGPESFAGLPGMILGLVINRLHTTWYATKVSVTGIDPKILVPPAAPRAEKMSRKNLIQLMRERFSSSSSRWGRDDRMLWDIMI